MRNREKIMLVGVFAVMGLLAMCGSALATWTTPVPVTELNGGYNQKTPFLTADGKSLYFARGTSNSIYQATRDGTSGPFTSVSRVLTDSTHVSSAWVSPDNLSMYYAREGSQWQIRVSTRLSVNNPWTLGSHISELDSLGGLHHPALTGDELTIFFDHITSTSWDIWTASRPDKNSAFGNVRSLTELNTSAVEGCSSVTADGLAIYFVSERNGSGGGIFKASRNSLNDPFGNVEQLSFLDSPGYVVGFPGISADGQTLYYGRGQIGSSVTDFYVTNIVPEPATVLIVGLGALMLRKKR